LHEKLQTILLREKSINPNTLLKRALCSTFSLRLIELYYKAQSLIERNIESKKSRMVSFALFNSMFIVYMMVSPFNCCQTGKNEEPSYEPEPEPNPTPQSLPIERIRPNTIKYRSAPIDFLLEGIHEKPWMK